MPPSHEAIIIGDRRAEKSRDPHSKFYAGIAAMVIGGFLLWLLTTAAGGGIVTGGRFVADSTNRDRERDAMNQTLDRIDSRVGAIYCAGLPKDKQAGCR